MAWRSRATTAAPASAGGSHLAALLVLTHLTQPVHALGVDEHDTLLPARLPSSLIGDRAQRATGLLRPDAKTDTAPQVTLVVSHFARGGAAARGKSAAHEALRYDETELAIFANTRSKVLLAEVVVSQKRNARHLKLAFHILRQPSPSSSTSSASSFPPSYSLVSILLLLLIPILLLLLPLPR
jgi:hypothetical protein